MIEENLDQREGQPEPNSAGGTGGGAVLDATPGSRSSDTPETDGMASMRRATSEWVRLCGKLERERNEYRSALKQIQHNPGWQDPEVGFMSGHIAAAVLSKYPENSQDQSSQSD
jgi:hypothetical protein